MQFQPRLERFFLVDTAGVGQRVPGLYEPSLVALSVLVAVLTSHLALQLAVKARQSPTRLLRRGMGEDEADDLLNAAAMHDVGKIGIPDAVLLKAGKLDPDEWAHMQRHPRMGAEIIGEHEARGLQMARRVALRHHEKWDGSGYPEGLAGEAIPLEARIVAVCDVFDALTSVRPYKEAWPVEKALDLLRSEAGRHFDPALVERFIALLPEMLAIRERWAD